MPNQPPTPSSAPHSLASSSLSIAVVSERPPCAPARRMWLQAGLSAATLWLAGCSEGSGPRPEAKATSSGSRAAPSAPARPVLTHTAETRAFVRSVPASVEFRSLSSPDISAELSARVRAVHVQSGQSVKKGTLLVTLDDQDAQLLAQEAGSQLEQLEVLRQERRRALERAQRLYEQDFISRAQRDQAQTDARAADAQWQGAHSRAQLARRTAQKTRLVAPFDATVVEVRAQPGALVRTGEVLLKLWSPQTTQLVLALPQEYVLGLKQGAPVVLRDLANKEHHTQVLRWSAVANPASRSVEVILAPVEQLHALAGAALRAELELEQRQALAVPASALLYNGALAQVFRVEQGKAVLVPVRVGQMQGAWAEVLEGLSSGAVVVTEGAAFLRPGQPVLTQPQTPGVSQAEPLSAPLEGTAASGAAR